MFSFFPCNTIDKKNGRKEEYGEKVGWLNG
jgi:hypothetical protein